MARVQGDHAVAANLAVCLFRTGRLYARREARSGKSITARGKNAQSHVDFFTVSETDGVIVRFAWLRPAGHRLE
jgi:hypothetical protein